MTIEFTKTLAPTPLPAVERDAHLVSPGFGKVFTDHMVTIIWTPEAGWHDAALRPYGPLLLDPATAVIHYGQSIFEGYKAYGQPDGSIATFRPDANGRRFQKSARRLALPELSVEDFVAAGDLLIETDRAWVGNQGETSLYLRPFMFASEAFLGVRPSNHVTFSVIASPAGAYFAGGVHPVSIWVSEEYTRAAPGGTGAAKCAGNYAASLIAQQEAVANGCDQVVFLDAVEKRWVEELGGMNVYFVMADRTLVTPPTSGTILEGVTRDAILTLAAERGFGVEERPIGIDEWRSGVADGSIAEVFACGTAAVVTPIGRLAWRGGEISLGDGQTGKVTQDLRDALLAVQFGHAADTHGWMHSVC
jgi:branched-chain amino acid aminotransferase